MLLLASTLAVVRSWLNVRSPGKFLRDRIFVHEVAQRHPQNFIILTIRPETSPTKGAEETLVVWPLEVQLRIYIIQFLGISLDFHCCPSLSFLLGFALLNRYA